MTRSEEDEGLLNIAFNALHLLSEYIEAHGLGEGTALANSHDISGLETECVGAMSGDGLVTLLKSFVLAHEMEVVTADDDVPVHFGRDHDTPSN